MVTARMILIQVTPSQPGSPGEINSPRWKSQ
jgi:hypothetical protein